MDAAHWPARRSHGATWGLLELIPLCRLHHRLLDDYVDPWPSLTATLASRYHQRMFALFGVDVVYLGPEERIREVMDGATGLPQADG